MVLDKKMNPNDIERMFVKLKQRISEDYICTHWLSVTNLAHEPAFTEPVTNFHKEGATTALKIKSWIDGDYVYKIWFTQVKLSERYAENPNEI